MRYFPYSQFQLGAIYNKIEIEKIVQFAQIKSILLKQLIEIDY
jgi:hypothetical protein